MDIIVSNLSKKFNGNNVLNGFNATFKKHTLTSIMGPSGCGKTTLLNILMGLMPSDSGTVKGIPNLKSAVFQEDRLCESFNAISNVRFVCEKGISNNKIISHFEKIGLNDCFAQPVRELSGGMKRRVAIVRAILAKSDILFLDEPFRGLDAETKKITMEYVKNNIKDKTVIMVTHNIDEAKALSVQMLIMKGKDKNDKN